jgi:hypothetical protein
MKLTQPAGRWMLEDCCGIAARFFFAGPYNSCNGYFSGQWNASRASECRSKAGCMISSQAWLCYSSVLCLYDLLLCKLQVQIYMNTIV